MIKVLVLNVKFYDFKNDQGQEVRGCNMLYINPEASDENTAGLVVSKMSFKHDEAVSLGLRDLSVPAFCGLEFTMKIDNKGQAINKVSKVVFLNDFDIMSGFKK